MASCEAGAVHPDFDPELYVRLIGERTLLDRGGRGRAPWDSPGVQAAAALIAVGLLDAGRAQAVLDDYDLAQSLRGQGGYRPRMGPRGQRPGVPVPLTAARIVVGGWRLTPEWGSVDVHYVALGDRSTSVAITARESSPGTLARAQGPQPGMPVTQTTLTDDQGTSSIAHFNGGGGPGGYHGYLTSGQPLSRSTRWIEIGESRLELDDQPTSSVAHIEALPSVGPAEDHLWRQLDPPRHRGFGPGPSVQVSIETLVAAGALAPDDPLIDELLAVSEALSNQSVNAGTLPEPWGSLVARSHHVDGPTGAAAIGVVTDPIDGTRVSAAALVSKAESFHIAVAVSPGAFGGRHPFEPSLTEDPLRWRCEDDRGNHYMGSMGNWGGGPDLMEGTIEFWPPLDPRAEVLRFTPTGKTMRAVITVPLPAWEPVA